MSKNQGTTVRHDYFLSVCIIMTLICGCSRFQTGSTLKEANDLFSKGDYGESLSVYERIIEKNPSMGDRVLFEMGIIYAYPGNKQKDYEKALQCFERLIRDYPDSRYRHVGERMIFQINNVIMKDKMIAVQQALITALQQEGKRKTDEIIALRKKKEVLEQKVFLMEKGPADKVLIEKRERRLTLISKGRVIKTYRIALGEDPNGPKVRQGDNKTPEGTYVIDSRNRDSRYHMSLHISYPNERDRKRAKALGVSPGGDIMIHGLKNGFSKLGALHTGSDWTKGCIAVTDEEIEEIETLVPNGTVVEIRP